MKGMLIAFLVIIGAGVSAQGLEINDSLNLTMPNAQAIQYLKQYDSVNRVVATPGMRKIWGQPVINVYYRNGLAYLTVGDSLVLFQVMIAGTENEVEKGRKELEAGCKQRRFHRKNRSIRSTKEVVERKKGLKETAYTYYTDEARGLTYRIFFREGRIYDMMLYLP